MESLINKKIESFDLYKISKIVVLKGLKVIESKGNKYATDILENRNYYKKDDFEDLQQLVIEQIIIDNYIVTRKAYKVVNDYINNVSKFPTIPSKNKEGETVYIKMQNVEFDNESLENESLINYISFLTYNNKSVMVENESNVKSNDIIEMLNLTEKQREILEIYLKLQNFQRVADFLGISYQYIQKVIYNIRNKIKTLKIEIA